jgi:hypothetical protein
MLAVWESIGFIRYPLTLSVLVVAGLTLWSSTRLFKPGAWPDRRTKVFVDAILFWGGFAVVTGVLGTLLGIILAAQSIEAAGSISTTLVWGGIKVALLSTALGFLILIFSSLVWFGLQFRWRMLEARDVQA